MTSDLLQAARNLVAGGCAVVPVPFGMKKPVLKGWESLRLNADDLAQHFNGRGNLGLLNGEPSGNRTDLDLDVPEAVAAAAAFLPPTSLMHGRKSNPASHWWYQVTAPVETRKFQFTGSDSDKPTMLVEVRSTGTQTLVPPSQHPDGEVYRWERHGEPARVTPNTLLGAAAKVAAVALVARHWPGEGSRDDAALALCGMLLRGGWSVEETGHFARTVARCAGDEEAPIRDKAAATQRKLEENAEAQRRGKPARHKVTGAPKLAELLRDGERVVRQVRDWLGLKEVAERDQQSTGTGGTTGTKKRTMALQSLADLEPQRIEYMMGGYLALGELNALAGAGGVGKTSAAMDLAVRVASGVGMPCGMASALKEPAGVLYLTTENHPNKVMRPRMEATALRLTDGDQVRTRMILERIYVQRGVVVWPDGTPTTQDVEVEPEGTDTLVLPRDLEAMREAIRAQAIKLVVIDPAISFTAADVDVLHPAELRHFLDPLACLAQEEDIAILALLHFTKTTGTAVILRISLSRQFTDTARIVSVVLEDPREEHTTTRWLAQAKTNLGATPPALSFQVQATIHPTFPDAVTAIVTWGETREGNADKVERDLAAEAEAAKQQAADPFGTATVGHKPRTKEAITYLGDKLLDLRDQGDIVVTGKELEAWREEGGFTKDVWSRAREHLGVSTTPGAMQGTWQQDLADLEWLERIPQGTRGLLHGSDPTSWTAYPFGSPPTGRKPRWQRHDQNDDDDQNARS
jgi:hypothetical protein